MLGSSVTLTRQAARVCFVHARTPEERAVLMAIAKRWLGEQGDGGDGGRMSFRFVRIAACLDERRAARVLHGRNGLVARGLIDRRETPNPRTGHFRPTYGLTEMAREVR